MLKAVANNAVGFAFKLAIDSISPQIGGVIDQMQDIANKVNQFNMQSCEAAAAAVGAVWPKIERGGRSYLSVDRHVCRSVLGLGEVAPRVRQWWRKIFNDQFQHGSFARFDDTGAEKLCLGHDQNNRRSRAPIARCASW
jgi:hypothetical protein